MPLTPTPYMQGTDPRWIALQEMGETNDDIKLQFESEYALSQQADLLKRAAARAVSMDDDIDNIITSKDALCQAAQINLEALVEQIDF